MTMVQEQPEVGTAILEALARCPEGITFTALYSRICPDEHWVSNFAVAAKLSLLVLDGLVHEELAADGAILLITRKGRSQLAGEPVDEKPEVTVSVCDHKEPCGEHEPAHALLCVDEDELDRWWHEQDVEAKADAFAQWSLGRDSHIHIEHRIPVEGAIGDDGGDDRIADFIKKHMPSIVAAVAVGLKRHDRLHERLRSVIAEDGGH